MKSIKYVAAIFLLLNSYAISFASVSNSETKKVTLEKIWKDRLFVPDYIKLGKSMKDGLRYSQVDNYRKINVHDYQTGDFLETVFSSDLLPENADNRHYIDNYEFCADEKMLLIAVDEEQIYRRSRKAKYYLYNIENGEIDSLDTENKLRIPTFSPDGSKIAFVKDNNIYIYIIETKETIPVTFDGKHNHIINGTTDWVYEEEFYLVQGIYWAPDSEKLAFYRFDESRVKEVNMMIYGTLYPEEYRFKYPKAGEQNAIVTIHIYNVSSGKTLDVDIGDQDDQYIPRVLWTNNPESLSVQRLNRHQNHLEILLADATTGHTHIMYEEHNKYFIEITDDLYFFNDKKRFIITSEKEGYRRVYIHDIGGQAVAITPAGKEVNRFLGTNEDKGLAYYVAFEDHPAYINLYSVDLKSFETKRLTPKDGHNIPEFSERFEFFINQYSTANTPPVFSIYKADGTLVKVLEDNNDLLKLTESHEFVDKEFFSFETSEGVLLNAYMIKPSDFDPEKEYPLLIYVYGGPGSQTVTNRWDVFNGVWFQMLADMGYIIVSVDNRGTGGRGEEFKKMTYLKLGKYETIDQIEAAKYLGSLNYIDAARIGIFGWSYGGYLSTLCLAMGADVFSLAIAAAPVTHWKFYDTIYTERYMRTPEENPDGYEKYSPINHVDKIAGSYLLVHGSADDNVHYQHTLEMADELIEADVQFDLMIYPNHNHSIFRGNARLHLYRLMTNFLNENFMN